MRIRVTKQHIKYGIRGSTSWCPVARACRASGLQGADVGDDELDFMVEAFSRRVRTALPPEAIQFIADFDDGKSVAPFEFEIEVSA